MVTWHCGHHQAWSGELGLEQVPQSTQAPPTYPPIRLVLTLGPNLRDPLFQLWVAIAPVCQRAGRWPWPPSAHPSS